MLAGNVPLVVARRVPPSKMIPEKPQLRGGNRQWVPTAVEPLSDSVPPVPSTIVPEAPVLREPPACISSVLPPLILSVAPLSAAPPLICAVPPFVRFAVGVAAVGTPLLQF